VNLACAECEPGVLDCAGLVPRQCSATGRYLRGAACSGDTPKCQDGQCVACQDGDTRPCADCSGIETCRANVFGACQSITPPSCTDTPDCHGSSCCQALFVEGGTYYFGPLLSYATSVTNFCLDQYEVTVGRFREFVSVYDTWLPEEAAGEHQPGAGTGWQSTWTKGGDLPVDAQTLAASLDCGEHPTWRATPGNAEAENLPQNCLTWHEAFAFCIWDGGRLATEAEWEYAAGGGAEERTYPWGDQVPDASQASFDCCADGDCTSCSDADLRPVGGVPAGNGRWGQSDLAGNVYEWVLDGHTAIDFRPSPCIDCAMTPSGSSGVQRGGGYLGDALSLQVVARPVAPRTTRSDALGVRCVRKR
jgi:formylglycine-generating enzyme required for sulfatase activity